MASLVELETALRNADAAGATEDARTLANAIVAMRGSQQPAEPQYKPRGIDYIQELPKGIVGGIAGIVESAALGGATLLPEKYEAPVREKIQAAGDIAQSFVTPDTGLEQGIPRKFGEALGSFAGILGTSLIPTVGIPAAGALAVGAGAGEASERAREAGATQEERTKASLLGAGVGATEILPIGVAFNRAKSIFKALPEKKTKELTDRILDVGAATTVEGAQEASAAILQNMIEQGYNPEQDTFEGAVEQGAYGSGVGFTVQTVLNFIDGRRNVADSTDDEPRSADGTQRVKDAVEGKVKLPSFDDFRRGQVEQQQEGKRFKEDFVDPLEAETDDAGIDTTRSGVSVSGDRSSVAVPVKKEDSSSTKVTTPAAAGLGRPDAPVDRTDVGKGPEAGTLTYDELSREQKRELAAAPENKKGEVLDSFVKEPEPVITPTSDAGNVKPNVKTKFDPKEDATLVDRRAKADPDPSKLRDVTTISGGTKEKDITSPTKTRKQFDSIGYQESKPEIGDLQETVKTKYKNSFPNIKIFGSSTSWDAAHMDGGVAIEYTQTKDKSRLAYLIAHELGHASHSLLGNKVNKNPNIKTELKAIENFIYPNLREQIKTTEAQNKNIDTEFFNYLLSPEELIAEFNVYRINNEAQASTIAPNLSKLLASTETNKNLVKPRNVFTGFLSLRSEVDGSFDLEGNPLIDEERIRNLEGKAKPFRIGLDKKFNDFKVAKKDNPRKALDIYNTFIKGNPILDKDDLKKEVAELEKKLAAPEVETPNMKQRLAAARTRMQAIGISKSITSSYVKDYDEATTIDAKTSILSEMENVSQQDLKKKRIVGERKLKKAEEKEEAAIIKEDLEKTETIEKAETLTAAQQKFIADRRSRETKISKEVDLEWRINFNKTASDKDKLIDEQYDIERTDDPVAIKDKRILLDLVTGKLKGVSTDKDMAAAKTYFSKVGNPANALDNIAFDIEHSDKNYRTPDDVEFIKNNYGEELIKFGPDYDLVTEYTLPSGLVSSKVSNEAMVNSQLAYDQHLKGTGEKFGLRAYAWMKKNLSKQTLDSFEKMQGKEANEKSKISQQNSSDSGIVRTLGKKSNKKLKNNPYDLFYDLPTAQISTLAMKLHPRVRAILRAGDLRGALEEIGLNPTLPKEITDLAKKLGEKLVDKKYLDKIKIATQDSKVKDIVYHGSPKKDITEFKSSDYTQGLYFSPNKGVAEAYVARRLEKTPKDFLEISTIAAKDGRVYEVMLDIKKPLMIKGTDKISLLDKIDLALGRKTKKELRKTRLVKRRASMTLSKERIAELKRQGYDGIMNEDMMEYVAFDASQVYIVNDPDSITKVKVNEKIKEETAGRFNPKTNTIEINPASGMNTHVLLHEVYHAVTSATLANKSHPLTKQLNALYNEVKPYLGTAYGAQSLDEFVSESQSNTEFRQELASINIKGQPVTALQRLNNILVNFLRRLIGRDAVPLTALESASPLIESIMEPAPKTRNAPILQMKTDQTGVKEVMANIGSTVKELSTVQGSIDQGKDFLFNGKITNGFKDFFLGVSDSIVAAKLGNEVGFKDEDGKSLGMMVHNISTRTRGKLGESHDKSNELLKDITTFARKYPEQYAAMNDYTYNNKYGATLFGVYRVKGFESTYLRSDNKTSKIMTLGDEKIKLKDIYDAQTPSWNGMNKDGANGQELLERIRQHYQKEFRALKDILFGRVNDTLGEKSKEAKQLRNTLSKIFEDKSILIYFPLVREGRYAIPYKLTNEASEGRINDDVFELISTKAAAERRYEELKNDPNVLKGPGSLKGSAEAAIVDTSKKSLSETFKVAPPAGFVAEVLTTVDKNPKAKSQTKADKDEIAALKEEIVNLYINTLPETSFAKSFAGRRNVLGYIDDTTTAFKKKGFEIPYSRLRLENSKLLLDVERKIRETAKILREEPVVKKDTFLQRRLPEVTRMENELLARSEFNRKGATGPLARYENIARNLNQGAFIYTIGFNVSSAVVNLSQVPLFVLPYQGAKYGYPLAMGAVGRATKYISASRADISKYFDADYNVIGDVPNAKKKEVGAYADIVKAAAENGMLQITSIAEFMGLQESGQRNLKTMRGKVDGVVAASAYAFNFAERMNRQVTLLSTYELALRKIMKMEKTKNFSDVVNAAKNEPLKIQEAVEQAMVETQETNGGHAIETAPRIFQQGVGRVAGMYKSFGVKMYSTMLQSTIQAINTDLPSGIRGVAIKQLIGVHGSALLFAGIHGVPIYGAIQLFSDLFLLDDDEDDFNTIVRKYVGEGWYKGPLNQLAGTDVASRIRLTGLLVQQNRFNPDASLEENAFFYVGGPAYSTVKRVGRGLKDLSEGEVERGIESLMPAAVSNMYRSSFGRLADEGYKTRRGDPIYDDVTGGELAFQFFGFAPSAYTFRQEQNNILKRIDTVTSRKRTKLLRKYYVARRNADYGELRGAVDNINKFNKAHPLAAITTDSIERSMRSHEKTSEKMAKYNGVSLSPRMKKELDINRSEWDAYD